jgi:hypothetical protein
MLLARVMEWGTTASTSPTFATYYLVATTGVPVFVPRGLVTNVDTYEDFAARMIKNFACV